MAGACALTAAYALLAVLAAGSNPLVPGVGMADPHIHIFVDTAYMYAGRDQSPTDDAFIMPDWNVSTSGGPVSSQPGGRKHHAVRRQVDAPQVQRSVLPLRRFILRHVLGRAIWAVHIPR